MMIDRLEELLMMVEENDNRENEVLPLGGVAERAALPRLANVEKEELVQLDQLEGELSVMGAATNGAEDSKFLNNDVVWQQTVESEGSQPPMAPAMKSNDNAERASRLTQSPQAIQAESAAQNGAENAQTIGLTDSGRRETAELGPKRNETTGGLEDLYRAATWAAGPLEPMGSGWEPMAMIASEPARPEGRKLTVGELDRAVRRDSRRYDGGMTIF